jgi:outer membrane protein assembly factor BamA
MRTVVVLALFAALCLYTTARAQDQRANPAVLVHSLTIESADLGGAVRDSLIETFQGKSCNPDELVERVRRELRDKGYFNAKADLDGVKESDDEKSADITIRVTAGAEYHLSRIRFTGATLIPSPHLRPLFPADDALYDASAIERGLDAAMQMYEESGYLQIAMVPTAKVDEDRRTIEVTFGVDEGKKYFFGRLLLNGEEPKAGAAESLQIAWASMHAKPYSPQTLTNWVAANVSFWPADARAMDHVSLNPNAETQQVDVVLELP